MNASMTYADGFEQRFAQQPDFLHFLQEVNRHSRWERKKAKNLRVIALAENDPLTQTLYKQYDAEGQSDLLDDTMEHTRLLLKAEDTLTPVRSCAVKTILERARINGYALNRLAKPQLAQILNYCLAIASGNALLWYSEGKVSAVHAGDDTDYAVLEIPDLFQHTVQYLDTNYPGYTFVAGSYDHDTVTALWELNGQDSLVETYREALQRHNLFPAGTPAALYPAVRLTTSNTGVSGANLYPMLLEGKERRILPLGTPVKREHKGGATLTDFDANLPRLFAQYDAGLCSLTALLDVELAYPVSAMQGVLRELGVAKRTGAEAVEMLRAQIGEEAATAHKVYYFLSEILFHMQRDGAPGARIAAMEEVLARALHVNWSKFDLPNQQ